MHDAQQLKIGSIFKEQKCARKILTTIACNIVYIVLAIYRLFNVKQLKQDIKSLCYPHFL